MLIAICTCGQAITIPFRKGGQNKRYCSIKCKKHEEYQMRKLRGYREPDHKWKSRRAIGQRGIEL